MNDQTEALNNALQDVCRYITQAGHANGRAWIVTAAFPDPQGGSIITTQSNISSDEKVIELLGAAAKAISESGTTQTFAV